MSGTNGNLVVQSDFFHRGRDRVNSELSQVVHLEVFFGTTDPDVAEQKNRAVLPRQRLRVPKQALLKDIVVARVVLQSSEDAGDGNRLDHVVEARNERSSPLRDQPLLSRSILLVDIDPEVRQIDGEDTPDDHAEE